MNLYSLFRNVADTPVPEDRAVEVNKSRFIIPHGGRVKAAWDYLIITATVYIAVTIPFEVSFHSLEMKRSLFGLDIAVEILFILDIILNFRTTFINKSGQEVFDARAILMHYVTSWFLVDLVAAVPIDLFVVHVTSSVHLLKAIRLLRLVRLLQRMKHYLEYNSLVVGTIMCCFVLLAHWLACIWYVIGHEELKTAQWHTGWLHELGRRQRTPYINHTLGGPSSRSCYIAALYFTTSILSSVGFGNVRATTNNEKIFALCAMLIAVLMYAFLFGNVTVIIQRLYAEQAMKRHAMLAERARSAPATSAESPSSSPARAGSLSGDRCAGAAADSDQLKLVSNPGSSKDTESSSSTPDRNTSSRPPRPVSCPALVQPSDLPVPSSPVFSPVPGFQPPAAPGPATHSLRKRHSLPCSKIKTLNFYGVCIWVLCLIVTRQVNK